jgi:hypothetical protein
VRAVLPPGQWRKVASATRPTERTDRLLILQRITD